MRIGKKRLYNHNTENNPEKSGGHIPSKEQVRPISSSLKENIDFIKKLFSQDHWLKQSEFKLPDTGKPAGVLYIEGLADVGFVNHGIVNRFSNRGLDNKNTGGPLYGSYLQLIKESFFPTLELKETGQMEQAVSALLDGNTCLFIDGENKALIISTRMIEKRSIDTSETEASIYGNKEAFTEDIKTNCMMIRRRLPTPDLQFKSFSLGRLSHTNTILMWIEGITNPKFIGEAVERIQRIDVDNIFGVSMISEMTEDAPLSIWPKYKMTEKPDAVVAGLAEGRFAILCDGNPFALIAPVEFWQVFQSPDDYAEKPVTGSFLRFIRILAFFISTLLSPLYLAFTTYNHTILPPDLAVHISTGRQDVPFPSIIEVILMTMVIDILYEAGARLPKTIGGAIGVLGAVVIGQSAVAAGYVSPSIIIIIAVTTVAGFTFPQTLIYWPTRLINYSLIIVTGILGLYGLLLGFTVIVWHLVSLRSFGIPFFYPVAPFNTDSIKDTLIRAPQWKQNRRPELFTHKNVYRKGPGSTKKPGPSDGKDKSKK